MCENERDNDAMRKRDKGTEREFRVLFWRFDSCTHAHTYNTEAKKSSVKSNKTFIVPMKIQWCGGDGGGEWVKNGCGKCRCFSSFFFICAMCVFDMFFVIFLVYTFYSRIIYALPEFAIIIFSSHRLYQLHNKNVMYFVCDS